MIEAPHDILVPLIQQAMIERGFVDAAKDFPRRSWDYGSVRFGTIMRLWGVS